jgi:ectoine hydroxylase
MTIPASHRRCAFDNLRDDPMRLSDAELQQYRQQGYLFFPNRFSVPEVAVLANAAAEVYALDRDEVWRESSGAPRTAFAAHTYNEAFRRLGAHPRLIEPVMQILGGPVYMHQYKVNAKAAFDGEVWQWHQDYGTWQRDDAMPEPRAMNIAVFVDDVTAANGPLVFIPGSHRKGVQEAGHDLESTSYPLWTLDRDTVTALAKEGGLAVPTGDAGGMIMFHGNLVHASPPNISPFGRVIVYLSLCHVDNHIRRFKRAEWIAHRDFTPIEPLADDCLAALSREQCAA